MRPELYTSQKAAEELLLIPGWEIRDNQLHRDFKFRDFKTAFAFMTLAAFEAEKLNHHPDWKNVYSNVSVTLHTHDRGGLTGLDFALAKAMNKILENGF
jgi:4a-hydroxytetrahydrobiopterin dehydratase